MTGAEFRAYRAAAGLSVRKAAAALDVSPSTIQRWQMEESRIPAAAAERIRELAQGQPPATARTLGTLFAVLEAVTGAEAPQSIVALTTPSPAAAFGQLLTLARRHRVRYHAHEGEVEELMGDLTAYPPFLNPVEEGAFWLAYYQRRACAKTS